jgi:arsenate reductase
MLTIYHNPRCSKSRQCLTYLNELDTPVKVINYFEEPFTEETLKEVLKKLSIPPIDLVRKNEKTWKELFKGKSLSDEALIKAMVNHPKLIQRPIAVTGDKAVICRPLEEINKIL